MSQWGDLRFEDPDILRESDGEFFDSHESPKMALPEVLTAEPRAFSCDRGTLLEPLAKKL